MFKKSLIILIGFLLLYSVSAIYVDNPQYQPNIIHPGDDVDLWIKINNDNYDNVAIAGIEYYKYLKYNVGGDFYYSSYDGFNVKQFSPYKNHTIYAGIAGFNIPDDVVEEALKRGYFVLKRSGEVIERFKKELLEAA